MAAWSEQEDAIVQAGFEQGRSGATIAADLVAGGFARRTRHAVLARIGQLGLQRRDAKKAEARPKVAPSQPFNAQFGAGTRGSKPLVRIPESRFTAGEARVRFLDRTERQCGFPKWADGTPLAQKMVCGAAKELDATYCPDCMARAYRPVPKQERRPLRRAA